MLPILRISPMLMIPVNDFIASHFKLKHSGKLMKNKEKLYSTALASIAIILFSNLVSSVALASTVQNNSSAAQYADITNTGRNSVSVIEQPTSKVTATVSGFDGPEGVAVNPEGTKVYTANWGSNTVSVIDTATNNVTPQ
jgi:YVTN family beta-propeller protein